MLSQYRYLETFSLHLGAVVLHVFTNPIARDWARFGETKKFSLIKNYSDSVHSTGGMLTSVLASGYVGATLAARLADPTHDVTALDIDETVVE